MARRPIGGKSMRPSGDSRPGTTIGLASTLVLGFAGLSAAQSPPASDGPDLAPPTNMPAPPASVPTPEVPPVAPASRRAVMAVPGLMGTPASRATVTPSPLPPVFDSPGGPTLDGPLEMPSSPNPARPRAGIVSRPGASAPVPFDELPMVESPEPKAIGSAKRTSNPSTIPKEASPASPRRGRFFGLLPGQPSPPGSNLRAQPAARPVPEEFKTEPTADSALKARIEKQARTAIGDRARSIEVRVEGRTATVQARGVRIFQKRAVRKSLEALPALSGLRSTIDVLD